VCLLVQTEYKDEWFDRFSIYDQMIRVVAQIRRFILRCQRENVESGFLKRFELDASLHAIVRWVQARLFRKLISNLAKGDPIHQKSLVRLSPFIDSYK